MNKVLALLPWGLTLRTLFALLLIASLLPALAPAQASSHAQAEMKKLTSSQLDSWLEGQYTGWVYFLARSDMDTKSSGEGFQQEYAVTLFHESHGTLDCSVFDSAGSGTCSGSFPLDLIGSSHGTATLQDCHIVMDGMYRGIAVPGNPGITSLVATLIGEGFSLDFLPRSGPMDARMQVTASGSSPTCTGALLQGQAPQGIRWSKLDFHVEYHTPLIVGGTCSMADFPREMTIGHAHVSAAIVECQWRMFFFDPYAKLP